MRLSIVLPCYNEAENLKPLLSRYMQVWEDLPAELILVDNGSTDGTAQVLEEELRREEHAFARTVKVPKNIGYGHGIATGLRTAQGEFVAFSHADMQCSPADVFSAYRKQIGRSSPKDTLIKGKRTGRGLGASLLTNGMSLIASAVLFTWLTDINAQPKVFHRSHLERLTNPPDGFEFDTYVLYKASKAGMDIATIPVAFGPRAYGQSKWAFSFRSRVRTIWRTIIYLFQLRLSTASR